MILKGGEGDGVGGSDGGPMRGLLVESRVRTQKRLTQLWLDEDTTGFHKTGMVLRVSSPYMSLAPDSVIQKCFVQRFVSFPRDRREYILLFD